MPWATENTHRQTRKPWDVLRRADPPPPMACGSWLTESSSPGGRSSVILRQLGSGFATLTIPYQQFSADGLDELAEFARELAAQIRAGK